MSKLVGQVTKISGEYVAKSADGTVKILAVGSLVYEDDLILGRKGIELEISLQNGDVLELQGNGVARLTPGIHSDLPFEKEDISIDGQSFFAGIDEGQFYLEDFNESSTATINIDEYLQGSTTERNGLETDIWASIDPHKASIAPEQLPGDPFESTIVPNTPPQILIDPFVTTDEDNILTISMRVIDTDGTVVTRVTALHGSVVVNNDGTITYSPDANYNGADTITITATDDDGASVIQTSSITINDVNDAPTLSVESTKTVDEDGTTTITYTTADLDGTAITTASALHGSVVVNNDGTITYSPDANYNGADTITITATDDDGASVIQTSSITINDVNDAPTLNSSASISFNEDILVTGAINASDVDGNTLSFSLQNGFTAPTGFVLNNNGTYSFDASSYDGLKAGETQDFSIPITISDGVGGHIDTIMNVTINGVNNDMTYTSSVAGYRNVFGYYEVDQNGLPIGTATIAIDDQHTISGGTHIADLDSSKNYGFFIIADGGNNIDSNSIVTFNTSGAQPVLLVNGNTIAKSVFHDNPDFNSDGKDHFIIVPDLVNGGVSIRVEDQSGLGNVNFMDMVVHSDIAINDIIGNDAQANNDSTTTTEKTSITISVLNNDVDGSSDTKTITKINGQNVSDGDSVTIINGGVVYGTATLNGNQVLFTPDVSLHQLSTNESQNVPFSYTMTDGHSSVNTATVTVTVTGTNDLPVVTFASTATVNEDSTVTINYSATDIEGAVTTAASSPNGTVIINNDGTLTFTPNPNFNGNTSITLSATDADGAVTSKTVAVSVTALNDGPDAIDDDLANATSAAPDGSYTLNTTNTIASSHLSSTLIGTDASDAINMSGQNINTGGSIDSGAGDDVVTLGHSSGAINTGDGNDKIVMQNQNSGGSIDTGAGDDVVNMDYSAGGTTIALGTGNDYLSATGLNGGAVDGGAGYDVVRISDQNAYNNRGSILATLSNVEKVELGHTDGSYKTLYKHTDGSWSETSNASEYLTSAAQEDTAYTITPSQLLANDTDVDGDTLTIVSVQNGTHGSVALVNGNVVFTPDANYNGEATFTYTISDGHGGSDTATVTLNIDSVNDAITQVVDTDTSANTVTENLPAGTYTGVTLLASDADGQAITYSVPNNVPFSVAADGKVYTTQALDYETTPSYTFNVTATSSDGTTSTIPVSVAIADIVENTAATITSSSTGSVAENKPIATIVYQATATDSDGDVLSYSLGGTDANYFDINSSTGAVTLKASANYELKSTYSIDVIANDGTVSTSKAVTINVTNVNEAPVFTSSATGNVDENSATSTVIYQAQATDVDAGATLTFSLSGTDAAKLNINSTTGEVTLKSSADFETKSSYSFNVVVSDGSLSATKAVVVSVGNLNEAPTSITMSGGSLVEDYAVGSFGTSNTNSGKTIATLSTVDPDAANTFTYSLSDPSGKFEIIGNTIVVKSGETLDYEMASSYPISVTTTDQNSLSYTQNFNLSVTNFAGSYTGTASDNIIVGTTEEDVIDGAGGKDTMSGGLGNDTYVVDNVGDKVIENGSEGIDTVQSSISYTLGTNVENLTLTGTNAINATGNELANTIIGNAKNNTISGGAGSDTLDGGAGTDTLDYSTDASGVTVTLNNGPTASSFVDTVTYGIDGDAEGDKISFFENITGGSGNDILSGDAKNNSLIGGTGDDTLIGGYGNDVLTGGIGADSMAGGVGTDIIRYDNDNSGVIVNLATQSVSGGEAQGDTISGIEQAVGGKKDDILTGDSAGNWFEGLAGNDTIDGAGGNDVILGGTGADTLIGGTGTDTLGYHFSSSGVSVDLAAGTASGGEAAGDVFSGFENLYGSTSNDILSGDSGINVITGNSGNDTMNTRTGNDTIDGGAGTDTAIFSGNLADYTITSTAANTLSVVGLDGVDTVIAVENLQFDDATYTTVPTISVSGGTYSENSGVATFTITRSGDTSKSIDVTYSTANGTGISASDYTAQTSQTITIPAGSTSVSVNIAINNDSVFEGSENLTLNLIKATDAVLASTSATATITDTDDTPMVTSVVGDTVVEGGSNLFTVTLSNTSTSTTAVTLGLVSDSATAGTDTVSTYQVSYNGGTTWSVSTPIATALSVPANSSSFLIKIATVNDTTGEFTESYGLSAKTASQVIAVIGMGTITDNDVMFTTLNQTAGSMELGESVLSSGTLFASSVPASGYSTLTTTNALASAASNELLIDNKNLTTQNIATGSGADTVLLVNYDVGPISYTGSVDMGSGNDTFYVQSLNGGSGQTIAMGSGDDNVFIGGTTDYTSGGGGTTIDLGTGSDRLVVASLSNTADDNGSSITTAQQGLTTYNLNSGKEVEFGYNTDAVTINAGAGTDAIFIASDYKGTINLEEFTTGTSDNYLQIDGTPAQDYGTSQHTNTVATIVGGAGDDFVKFEVGRDYFGIANTITFTGGDGVDTLFIDKSQNTSTTNVTTTNVENVITYNGTTYTATTGKLVNAYNFTMTQGQTIGGLPAGSVLLTSKGVPVTLASDGTIGVDANTGNHFTLITTTTKTTSTGTDTTKVNITIWDMDPVTYAATNEQTVQLSPSYTTPIMLDLNGDGIHTVNLENGVKFDINADGKIDNVGWSDGQDGMLVRDINQDGEINDGSELFGSATTLSDGSKASDGYEALRDLDANKDNVIDDKDSAYNELKLWIDGNQDGKVDDGEMMSLKEAGVESMSLKAESTLQMNEENIIGLESSYTTTSGETHAMGDVWLKTSESTDTSSSSEEIRFDGLASMIMESSTINESSSETTDIALSSIFTLDEDPSLSLFAEDLTSQAGVSLQTNPTATKTAQEEVELYIDNSAENTMLTIEADPQANTGL